MSGDQDDPQSSAVTHGQAATMVEVAALSVIGAFEGIKEGIEAILKEIYADMYPVRELEEDDEPVFPLPPLKVHFRNENPRSQRVRKIPKSHNGSRSMKFHRTRK